MTDPFIKQLIHNRLINVKDYIINNYTKLELDEKLAMLLLHIYNVSEQGEHFLSINNLKDKMTLDFVECSNLVLKLVQANLIAFDIVVDNNGKRKEKFTLEPLYQRILQDLIYQNDKEIKVNRENDTSELVYLIEKEFGRTLSSFEMQMIASWINEYHYDLGLIKLAIKEALLSSAYNLKYVDRILLTWQQKNIQNVEQAREYTKTFKRYEVPKKEMPIKEEEVYVSWMK
ncbi:DnaD domain protein [Mycoplasmatota bacterium]|nr:DnaD domain protein [Mycoplasmatota bacterium]